LELKLIEESDSLAIEFKLTVKGKWSNQLWAEEGDLVRIIGEFAAGNNFSLILDDDEELGSGKASMLIVEPFILLPTTQIVKAFPCARSTFL